MNKFYLSQFKKSVWWHRSRLASGKYPVRSSVGYPARLMPSVVSVSISRRMSEKYAWRSFLHTVHVVPRCRAPNPCLPQQQDTIPYVVKTTSVLRSWRWAKVCPKHVELILEINKTVIVASRWFLYYLTCYIMIRVYTRCSLKFSLLGTQLAGSISHH